MNKFIPSKVLRIRPTDPVWWTPECSAAVEAKRKAWNLHHRNRDNVVLQEAYNITRTATANCLTRTQALHMQQIRRKLLSGSMRDREWWSTVKRAGGHGRQSTIPVLVDKSGQEHTRSCDKAEVLGQYFAEKCSLERDFDSCTPTLPNVRQRSPNVISTIYFRLSTVLRTLKHLHPCKATGPDGIPARVLKMCADTLAYPLSKLYTLCFRTGIQPAAWKVANVVPVFKKGSKSIPKNYRPISLLSIISKCMESIINRSISNFLERNAILSPTQFGFRAGLGTVDLLLALHHEWSRNTNQGGLVRVLAVDIAGAFDKVSHREVLHKAAQYGIQGCLHNWLRSYLHDRKIRVVVGGQSSSTHTIKSGVPQGSILGPTLFLLYTNDAEDHLPPETQLAVYADDTTLYNCIASREGTLQGTDILQQAVDALADWGGAWRIKFEPSKSQALVISHHRTPIALPPITFHGTAVPEVDRLLLLGVLFDRQLSFQAHIRRLAVRGSQRLGFLQKASRDLDPSCCTAVYNGFVSPVMEYAMLTWMSAAPLTLARLSSVQRRALHIIGDGAYLPSLEIRRAVGALCFIYKLHYHDGPDIVTALLPPPAPPLQHVRTRHCSELSARHAFQLECALPRQSRNNVLRSFPDAAVGQWNHLPCYLLREAPSRQGLQTFKTKVYHHLRNTNWTWATQSL